MKLVFATANAHKVGEVQQLLGNNFEITTPADLGLYSDIPETGDTLQENALQKARFVWEKFGLPCFGDDTGLEVDALNGAPGVYSARYAGEGKSAEDNVRLLLANMQGVANRAARFRSCDSLDCGRQRISFRRKSGRRNFTGETRRARLRLRSCIPPRRLRLLVCRDGHDREKSHFAPWPGCPPISGIFKK